MHVDKTDSHKYHISNKYWGDGTACPGFSFNGRDAIADTCGCDLTVGQAWGHFGRESKSLPLALYALCKRCYPVPEPGDRIDHVFFCGKVTEYASPEYYEQTARFEALRLIKDFRGFNLDHYMDHPRVLYNRKSGIDLFTVSPYDNDFSSDSLWEIEDYFRKVIAICSPEYLRMYSVKAVPTQNAVYAPGDTITIIISTVHQADKTLKPFDWDNYPRFDRNFIPPHKREQPDDSAKNQDF